MNIYHEIVKKKEDGIKQIAVLIDPDKVSEDGLRQVCSEADACGVDYFFVGGSLLTHGDIHQCVSTIKSFSKIPIVLFPGSVQQITPSADALLFLSLISGRNPDLLIGQHVTAAPLIKQSGLEVISTGYILMDSGNKTTVQYISNTTPIPSDKPDIAACTALAGEMLGMKIIFAEAGSGALNPVSEEVIKSIRDLISIPLIVGGGIRTPAKALANCKAGADLIVVGNGIEKDISLIRKLADAVHSF